MKRKEEEFTLTAYFLKGIAFHLTEGGIEPSSPLHIALGATFDWKDLFAYAIGGVGCVVLESRTSCRDSDLGSKAEREKLNECS